MRTTWPIAAAALLLMAGSARAQDTKDAAQAVPAGAPDLRWSNYIDLGFRGTSFESGSDQARYQRFRDLRDGGTVEAFRYGAGADASAFTLQADHVGYRDQRYAASYNRYGKVKASFEFNQIPLFFSQDTLTLYTNPSAGVYLLPDTVQSGLQNKTLVYATVPGLASPFDLRLKRSIADFRLTYSATEHLDVSVNFRNTAKAGSQPWAGTFGVSTDAVELAAPVDTRTTEIGTAVEWANGRGSARVGYDGSFFRNNIGTLVWDNPLRVTDSPTLGPVQGREALWPNSDLNSANLSGLLSLPWHSRATAYLSVGSMSQDNALIPFTINSALPATGLSLSRPTSDVQARVTSMTYSLNSKPASTLWLNARFRSYDFDNRTVPFALTNTVSYDTTVSVFAEGHTSPYAFTRRTFDADASFTPVTYTALRVGYTHEVLDQTFRSFDTVTDDTIRLSADATGISWLTLRAVFEHAKRVGTGLDEGALDDAGEQVSLRQFDISDRTSNRFSGIVQLMPVSDVSFNATASVGREDRPGAVFGLRSNDNNAYSVGADFVPRANVSLGLNYEYEKYASLQNSRQANPGVQFNDPTRDWTTDGADTASTFTASMDLLRIFPKTDLRAAYNYSHAESTYVYGLAPNSMLVTPVQLPTVMNEFQRGTLELRYYLTSHLAAGFVYWYDKYDVNDFALGQQTLTSIAQPSFLMLGYLYKPYTANTAWGKVTYLW